MKYEIKFADGIVYTSPDIRERDPGWATEAEGKKLVGIAEMKINLPNKSTLLLKGFEKYNFFVEASQSLNNKGKAKIEAFYFCGAYRGHVVIWKIDYQTKQIIKNMTKEGEEYGGGATRGWRMGLMGEKAESGLLE